jgi:hypothetical protein
MLRVLVEEFPIGQELIGEIVIVDLILADHVSLPETH